MNCIRKEAQIVCLHQNSVHIIDWKIHCHDYLILEDPEKVLWRPILNGFKSKIGTRDLFDYKNFLTIINHIEPLLIFFQAERSLLVF